MNELQIPLSLAEAILQGNPDGLERLQRLVDRLKNVDPGPLVWEYPDVECGFNEAWIGRCKNKVPCEKHSGLKCCRCGKPATRSCEDTFALVCGAPLCATCRH